MDDWPAAKVEMQSITDLLPYPNNARTHSEDQINQIAASMKEWGWTNPILIDEDNGIIAGHGRVEAAKKLNIKSVPVMTAKGWTEAQKKAYVLADNQLALNASWDSDLLRIELTGLDELDFNLDLIGFDNLDALMFEHEGLTDPDDVPETSEDPITKPGDLWILGNHRVLCGDSTKAEDVERLLNGVQPHLMVTDPPYGVKYDPSWHVDAAKNGKIKGAGRRGEVGTVTNDDNADWSQAYALFSGDVCYVWHASLLGGIVKEGLEKCGFNLRSQIIWKKASFAIGRGHYHWQHETCWYAVRGRGHWHGNRSQSTVWDIEKKTSETGHSTQKPVECMRRPIVNNSSVGQAIYEPFCGSGTTIIAAEMEGRHCYAIEIAPEYVDVIVKRWQDYTGEKAVNEQDKRTFGA